MVEEKKPKQIQPAKKKNTEQDRTLYLRFPKTIKSIDEVRDVISGDADIKIPRQAARHCHVIFPTVTDKINNLKLIKKKNGVLVSCAKFNAEIRERKEKKKEKKVTKLIIKKGPAPKKKPALPKILTKSIVVFKIPEDTKLFMVKKAFPGCKGASWMTAKATSGNKPRSDKTAMVKLASTESVENYLRNRKSWPVINGGQVVIAPDKRKTLKPKAERSDSSVLKIYDEGKDVSKKLELKKKPSKAKLNANKAESEEEDENVAESEEEEEDVAESDEEEEDVADNSDVDEQEDSEDEDDEENENSDDEN